MSAKYKIYAVIVTYNGARWIEELIQCIRQEEHSVRIVIVDNASVDSTVEKINQNDDVALIRMNKNCGFGVANNIGIKYCIEQGADFVALINQDVSYNGSVISSLLTTLQMHPEYGLLSPIHLRGDGLALDRNFSHYLITPDNAILSDFAVGRRNSVYRVNFINAAFWFIRRNCLDSVGGFDPLFKHYGEDNDFVSRLHYKGFCVGVAANTFIRHDRPQIPISEKRGMYGLPVWIILELKIIQRPFIKNVLKVVVELITKIVGFILLLKLRKTLTTVLDLMRTIVFCGKVRKAYKRSKFSVSPFLR